MPVLAIRPLTPGRWPDLEQVFLARGCSVARGCWCMYYRETGDFIVPGMKRAALARRERLKALVDGGPPPGLIAYLGKKPVGWVTLGPREGFRRLESSRAMKAVDDQPVWSIVCFVVPSEFRGQGIARALLDGAVAYARKRGATIVEAYPKDVPAKAAATSMWFGAKSMYDQAGFEEVARRTPTHPVVRKSLARAPAREPAARGNRRRKP